MTTAAPTQRLAAPAPAATLSRAELGITAAISAYLGVLGILAIPATLWAFRIADRFTTTTHLVRVEWFGPDFVADAFTSALLLAVVGAVVGSVVQAGHLFSRRVGRNTFEASYLVWYLLRPLLSALLGMAFLAVVRGGLVTLSPGGAATSAPVLAFSSGALAGLFLDAVLQKMRALLGALPVNIEATRQTPPDGAGALAAQEAPVKGAAAAPEGRPQAA